jgi:UDP-N-acetyl-D-mannosaminuronate dehydrogenase
VLHVCIPYRSFLQFATAMRDALLAHLPEAHAAVVVHSTVPLGTTRRLMTVLRSDRIVFSPVRGTHPDLREGLLTFVKYIGGPHAATVSRWFEELGMKTRAFLEPETPEAIKLWDTTQYGWQIVLAKEIASWCREHDLSFDEVYRFANHDYNAGYEDLGQPEVVRPSLRDMPGPIGGHCVIPNLDLLGHNRIADTIRHANDQYAQRVHATTPTDGLPTPGDRSPAEASPTA